MNSKIYILIIILTIVVSNVFSAEDWTQITPSPNPGNRGTPGFCYIGDDKIIFFGGVYITRRNDTWIFDMSERTWTELTPATSPSARNHIYMAYIGDDKALLFGGYTTGLVNDTWVFDLSDNNWTQQSPIYNPAARYYANMAYLGDDKVLLYGGVNQAGTALVGTFVYDLSDGNWTSMSPSGSVGTRTYPGLAYIGDDKVLLYGGYAGGNELNDTRIYDFSDNAWTNMYNSTPGGLSGPHIVYIGNSQAVLYGGWNNGSKNDTWIYDYPSNDWSLDPNTTTPPATSQGYIATSSLNGTSKVMFMYSGQWWLFGGGDVALPIELSSFAVETANEGVLCRWTTESEIENLGFILERKTPLVAGPDC